MNTKKGTLRPKKRALTATQLQKPLYAPAV